jgi:hypothetical protein
MTPLSHPKDAPSSARPPCFHMFCRCFHMFSRTVEFKRFLALVRDHLSTGCPQECSTIGNRRYCSLAATRESRRLGIGARVERRKGSRAAPCNREAKAQHVAFLSKICRGQLPSTFARRDGGTAAAKICGKLAVVPLVAGIVADSCAYAAIDHAAAIAPNRHMNSRRFTRSPRRRGRAASAAP